MKFQDGRHASFKPESRVRRRNASSLRNADCCHGKLSNLMQRGAILETISSPPTRCISHVPARDTRPSYPRFRHVKILLSGTLSCAKTDDERSIEGGWNPLLPRPSWHVATCRNSSSLRRRCGGTMMAGQLIFYGSTRRAWDARGLWMNRYARGVE